MKNYRKYIGAVALTLSIAGFIAYNAQAENRINTANTITEAAFVATPSVGS